MNLNRWKELLHRDGWLYAALVLCVALGLVLNSLSSRKSDQAEEISRVLSQISGVGEVSVTIYQENDKPCGAVAVATGAQEVSVRLQLQQALETLLGLDASRIGVYPRQGGQSP